MYLVTSPFPSVLKVCRTFTIPTRSISDFYSYGNFVMMYCFLFSIDLNNIITGIDKYCMQNLVPFKLTLPSIDLCIKCTSMNNNILFLYF